MRQLAERSDTKSNQKLGEFQSRLQAFYVYSHTEELWHNESVCVWIAIYIYIYMYMGGSLSGDGLTRWTATSE